MKEREKMKEKWRSHIEAEKWKEIEKKEKYRNIISEKSPKSERRKWKYRENERKWLRGLRRRRKSTVNVFTSWNRLKFYEETTKLPPRQSWNDIEKKKIRRKSRKSSCGYTSSKKLHQHQYREVIAGENNEIEIMAKILSKWQWK